MSKNSIIEMFKEGADEVTQDMNKIVGQRTTPTDYIPVPTPGPAPAPVAFNMLDLSSPANAIIKSLFLLSLSPMFIGTNDFYFLSVGCSGVILYSLFKLINR